MTTAPHDIQAEQALVGSVLIDASVFSQVSDVIRVDDIYNPGLQAIWSAFERLDAKGEPIDSVTVYDEAKGYPGIATIISDTMSATPYVGNPSAYAKIIADNATYRRLIEAARKIAELGYSSPESTEQALDRAESILFAASRSQRSGRFWTAPDMVGRAYDRIARIAAGEHRAGVPTGFASIDRVTGGWQRSDCDLLDRDEFGADRRTHAVDRQQRSAAQDSTGSAERHGHRQAGCRRSRGGAFRHQRRRLAIRNAR